MKRVLLLTIVLLALALIMMRQRAEEAEELADERLLAARDIYRDWRRAQERLQMRGAV